MNITDNGKIKKLGQIKEWLFDALWPKRCIKCNGVVRLGKKEAICKACEKEVLANSKIVIEPDRYFEEAVCALPYEDHVRKYMIDYKFNSYRYLCYGFSKAIEKMIDGREFLETYDIICPVPIHHMRDREYNQSFLVANELAQRFDLEIIPDLLVKTKNIRAMSSMGYAMRYASITGAIDFNLQYDIYGKNIILVDDIYTTGSTADECAKILRMHGCESVIVVTACYRDAERGNEYDAYAD